METLTALELRQFRCFERLRLEFAPGSQFFVGPNARGKTSVLEAACVLLRLASPRTVNLRPLVRFGAEGFALWGEFGGRHLRFVYGADQKQLVLDGVPQTTATDYLRVARVVYFGNADLELVRGGSEVRRRYLDFLGTQLEPLYRANLRAYERALRSRNRLLKTSPGRRREIAAYDVPLVEAGSLLLRLRRSLAAELAPWAARAQRQISGADDDALDLVYRPGLPPGPDGGADDDLAAALRASQPEEERLRTTLVGPHRDDLELTVGERPAAAFASEGQQRTIVLALKLAQAGLLTAVRGVPPVLLLDDVFGELDPGRRNALLDALPGAAQQLVTTTSLDWLEGPPPAAVWRLEETGLVEVVGG